MIGKEIDGKVFTYKDFKRRVSHIESVFPTWMMSANSKHTRIFMLDNRVAQEIWEIEPLKSIKRTNDINFIEVVSLCKKNGERINVHNVNNVVNLTDSEARIVEKIANIDLDTKKMMITLMDENIIEIGEYTEPSEKNIDEKLLRVINNNITKYKLNDYELSLEKYKLDE
jgi:hypothetical protein